MRKTLTAFVAALVGVVAVPLALAGRFDGAPASAASVVPMKVITWNICGEFTGCPKTLTAAEMTAKRDAVLALVNAQSADAIMLNETCEWYANTLITLLNKNPDLKDPWQMSFFGARQSDAEATTPSWPGKRTRTCSNSRFAPLIEPDGTDQALGVAILTKGAHDQTTAYELPSPTERWTLTAPLLCVRKINGPNVGIPENDLYEKVVRLCISHFTPPGYDPGEVFRTSQADRVAEIVSSFGNERVIVGGDLNSYPPAGTNGTTPGGTTSSGTSSVLHPLYDLMRECAQPADGVRRGPATTWWGADTNPTYGKLDYLFARAGGGNAASLVTACPAQAATKATQPSSDHAPVVGAFLL
jgi:Endonuclease/Exonuclease/phosphatase family